MGYKPYPYTILLPLSFRIRTSQVGVLLWIYFCILYLYTELCLPQSRQQCQAALHRAFSEAESPRTLMCFLEIMFDVLAPLSFLYTF